MTHASSLPSRISDYWDTRAEGYSLRTIDELASPEGERWVARLTRLLDLPPSAKVADAGCGPGFLALAAAKAGWKAVGFDASPGMLEEARRNAAAMGLPVDFIAADAAALPVEDGSLDAILSRNVIWNLPDPLRAFRDWFRALKPGGELFYADGNHYRYLEDLAFARLHQTEAVPYGHSEKFMLGVDTSPMERIAEGLPLTHQDRPGWDVESLLECGFSDVTVLEPVLVHVTDPATGREAALVRDFMVLARKPF